MRPLKIRGLYRKVLGISGIIVFVIMIAIAPYLAMMKYSQLPAAHFETGDKVPDGSSSASFDIADGITSKTLLNRTPYTAPVLDYTEYLMPGRAFQDVDGYHVIFPHDRHNRQTVYFYSYEFLVPTHYTSYFNFSTHIRILSHTATVVVIVRAIDFGTIFIESDRINATETVQYARTITAEQFNNTQLLTEIQIKVGVYSSSGAHIVIQDMVVAAQYTEPLQPVEINVQGSDGSLFLDDYFKSQVVVNLFIQSITNNTSFQYSMFHSNLTLYLPSADYRCHIEWARIVFPVFPFPHLEFTVRPGNLTEVVLQIKVIKLYFDVSPNTIWHELVIFFNELIVSYHLLCPFELSNEFVPTNYIYLPAEEYQLAVLYKPFPISYESLDYIVGTTVLKAGANDSKDIHFCLQLTSVSPLGLEIGIGEIIGIAMLGYCVVASILWIKWKFGRTFIAALKNYPHSVPVVLTILGAILPWTMKIGQDLASNTAFINTLEWPAPSFGLIWATGHSVLFIPKDPYYFLLALFPFAILLAPAIYFVKNHDALAGDMSALRTFQFLLVLPYLLVVETLFDPYLVIKSVSFGFVCASLALPVHILLRMLRSHDS